MLENFQWKQKWWKKSPSPEQNKKRDKRESKMKNSKIRKSKRKINKVYRGHSGLKTGDISMSNALRPMWATYSSCLQWPLCESHVTWTRSHTFPNAATVRSHRQTDSQTFLLAQKKRKIASIEPRDRLRAPLWNWFMYISYAKCVLAIRVQMCACVCCVCVSFFPSKLSNKH